VIEAGVRRRQLVGVRTLFGEHQPELAQSANRGTEIQRGETETRHTRSSSKSAQKRQVRGVHSRTLLRVGCVSVAAHTHRSEPVTNSSRRRLSSSDSSWCTISPAHNTK
jgi:hypothetical protein